MRAETSRYGLTPEAWESVLLLAHNLCSANPDDIDQPVLANLMRLVKEPNAEGVSAMSAIVWEAIQKANAQAIKQTSLDLAAKFLTLGVDIVTIMQATGLSEEEIRDQLALSTP